MTRRRSLAVLALSAIITIGLTGCIGLPSLPGADSGTSGGTSGGSSSEEASASIEGTTWAGTDSDGDTWQITFQSGGGVAFSYNDGTFDDDTDTWSLEGQDLTITIVFDEGTATMTGTYVDPTTTISLDGQEGSATWTLDLQPA